MNRVIFCPKCTGENVSVKQLTPDQCVRVSMDDLGSGKGYNMPLVNFIHRYRAVCWDCGYQREYTTN